MGSPPTPPCRAAPLLPQPLAPVSQEKAVEQTACLPSHLLRPSTRDREIRCWASGDTEREVSLFAHRGKGTHEIQGQAGHQGAVMTQAIPASLVGVWTEDRHSHPSK